MESAFVVTDAALECQRRGSPQRHKEHKGRQKAEWMQQGTALPRSPIWLNLAFFFCLPLVFFVSLW
jgi:hypothetical protein